ncbi:MAG: haloacid dehalogenase type II [Thermodesulfobacteriota bacterium]
MNATMQDVKVCAFDMFGTLFDVHSVVQGCRDAFGPEGEEFSRFWRAKQLEYSWLRALMGRYVPFWQITQDSLDTALRRYGRGGDEGLRARLLTTYKEVRPFPEAAEALDKLAGTGIRRVVLTNGSRDMVNSALAAAAFTEKFEGVFSVDDVRTFKPNPAVYEMAHRGLAVEKHEIVMVSAHPWDLAGAISYGLQGLWIDRPGAGMQLEALGFDPQYRVTDLTGIADLVERT